LRDVEIVSGGYYFPTYVVADKPFSSLLVSQENPSEVKLYFYLDDLSINKKSFFFFQNEIGSVIALSDKMAISS